MPTPHELHETDRDTWLDGWLEQEPDSTLKRIVQDLRADLEAAQLADPLSKVALNIVTLLMGNSWNTDQVKALVEDYAIHRKPAVVLPPTPDQVALAFCQALLTRPDLSDEAAIGKAWHAVPEFYRERLAYPDFAARVLFGFDGVSGASRAGETGVAV